MLRPGQPFRAAAKHAIALHNCWRGERGWPRISSRIGRALISVSDKTGLVDLARALAPLGVELLSTGGTAAALNAAGFAVVDVAQITGFPEMMDGRIKTLHPRVHGGLLAIRSEPAHQAAMIANDIAPIDLLVVNLYPFEATLRRGASFDERIENIDIGGPAMIRAAAKNHDDVAVIVDVADYSALIDELQAQRGDDQPRFPPQDGAESLRAHRGLRRGDLQLAGARDRGAHAEMARLRRRSAPELRRAALRREPAAARGAVPDRRDPPRRRDRAPDPGQGAVLQQHQRHRRRLRAGRRIRSSGKRRRRRSSSTRIRAASRIGETLLEAYEKALSSRSGLGLRRRRGAQPAARRR